MVMVKLRGNGTRAGPTPAAAELGVGVRDAGDPEENVEVSRVVPEVTLTEATVDIAGVVTGTNGLAAGALKVAVVSVTMGPDPVAATSGVSRVVVFRVVVGCDPSP